MCSTLMVDLCAWRQGKLCNFEAMFGLHLINVLALKQN